MRFPNITPDEHEFQLDVLITSGSDTWTSAIYLTAYEANVFNTDPAFFDVTHGNE